jgi:glycosyltransferase involved in cell wall biosynthesis
VSKSESQPLVTVITSCFNHEPYLDDYFIGLLAQTYENVELIIFDDESADGSWKKITDYLPLLERKFTRVIAERHDHAGSPTQFDRALEKTTGELLCILDSDDYFLPTKLEENVRLLVAKPEVGAVHSDTDYLYPDGIEQAHWRAIRRRIPTGRVYAEILRSNFIMTCAFCCRTDLMRAHVDLKAYIRRGYLIVDWPIFMDLARNTLWAYIDRPLARYRVTRVSASRPKGREERFELLRSVLAMRVDYSGDPSVPDDLSREVKRDYYRLLYRHGLGLGRSGACQEGYDWLCANYPREYGRIRHRLASRIAKREALWRIGDRLGVTALVWRSLEELADARARLTRSANGPRATRVGDRL